MCLLETCMQYRYNDIADHHINQSQETILWVQLLFLALVANKRTISLCPFLNAFLKATSLSECASAPAANNKRTTSMFPFATSF